MFDLDRWSITTPQADHARAVLQEAEGSNFFEARKKRNIEQARLQRTPEVYWRILVGCVVTTQQRSGPGTIVGEFVNREPFPLRLSVFENRDPVQVARETLSDNGLPGKQKGRYIGENYNWFTSGGADYLEQISRQLEKLPSEPVQGRIFEETMAALAIKPYLLGIGPKQSRNFWQWLGLSQWEIPLDSRVLGWLKELPDIPPEVQVSQSSLSDEETYRAVVSWIQALSREVGTKPCLLDAAVFISNRDD